MFKRGIVGLFLVVQKRDYILKKADVTLNPSHLKEKFIISDLASCKDKNSPYQLFSPLTSVERIKLEKACSGGVLPSEFDRIVCEISQSPKSIALLLTSKIDASCFSVDGFCGFCQIYAGGGSLVTDESFSKFNIPNLDLVIKHKVATIEEFKNFIPLSASCFDTQFHDLREVPNFFDIVTKGLGKRGLFPSRNCSCHCGHLSYLGKWPQKSQNLPNPSEGPGEHGRWY